MADKVTTTHNENVSKDGNQKIRKKTLLLMLVSHPFSLPEDRTYDYLTSVLRAP